jgi:hypothetical protein
VDASGRRKAYCGCIDPEPPLEIPVPIPVSSTSSVDPSGRQQASGGCVPVTCTEHRSACAKQWTQDIAAAYQQRSPRRREELIHDACAKYNSCIVRTAWGCSHDLMKCSGNGAGGEPINNHCRRLTNGMANAGGTWNEDCEECCFWACQNLRLPWDTHGFETCLDQCERACTSQSGRPITATDLMQLIAQIAWNGVWAT